MPQKLYIHGSIITVNKQFDVIEDGAIAVDGDTIQAVGSTSELSEKYSSYEIVDMSGQIIMPGLISLHVHLAQSLLRSAADDLELIPWLCDRVWPMQGHFSEEDGYCASQLTIAEMLKSGTTTFVEALFAERYGFEGAVRAVEESGIRGCLGKVVMDQPRYATQDGISMHSGLVEGPESLENALKMHDLHHGKGNGRVEVWFGARTPGGVSEDLYRRMVKAARDDRKGKETIGITMHCAEVKADRAFFASKGHTPMTYCQELGILGPKTVLAHMVHLDDNDIQILSRSGASVGHCPTSNAKLASGIARVKELLENDCIVGLGCDGCPCNNVMDLLQEMKLAALLPKAIHGDPKLVDAKTIVEMATIHGAKAIGHEHDLGSLEVGKKADFIGIKLGNKLHGVPLRSPVSAVVYIATGADVSTVVVDGKTLVENYELLTMDEAAIVAEAQKRGEEVRIRASC